MDYDNGIQGSLREGAGVPKVIDDLAHRWVGQHYLLASALMLVLVIVVGWMVWEKVSVEGFNPTATMRLQQRSDLGAESMNGAPAPGSLGHQVLNSPNFDCQNREVSTGDAWAWQSELAANKETAKGGLDDNDLSRIAAGF